MGTSDTLVSVGLPVYNGADQVEAVIACVLAQDHPNLELVICDNASTDGTAEICRAAAAADDRVVYHRQPENVGLLRNFQTAIRVARGEYFRWIGDDDWIAPNYFSRVLARFDADPRLVLVTTDMRYTGPEGVASVARYSGKGLDTDDPVERLATMLDLLNTGHLTLDPLYGTVRRAPVVALERRNMLREDEVFATKLALAGPWGHVGEVLAHRHLGHAKLPALARLLEVPAWHARVSTTLEAREILRAVASTGLDAEQQWLARAAVARMVLRRQRLTLRHRTRKLVQLAAERAKVG